MPTPRKSSKRAEYERQNPTFSARIDLQTYERAKELCRMTGKSFGDLLAELVGRQEAPARESEARGFERGIKEARDMYAIRFPCADCGKPAHIRTPVDRAAVVKILLERGFHHTECPER